MDLHEHEEERYIPFESSNIANSEKSSSKISHFVERAHSAGSLHVVSSLGQMFLGSAVVIISILGLIHPLWVAALLLMAGSITTVVGIYFFYTIVVNRRDPNHLIRDAIRRVMDSQN